MFGLLKNEKKDLDFQKREWMIIIVYRALTVVELYSYIAILAPQKHKNQHHNSGAKGIFFTFIAIVHNYLWLCTVAKS